MTGLSSRAPGRAVADYVSTRAGLAFAGARESALRASLSRAVQADATLAALPLESEAFARLCDSLTVQESFFFREPAKLALLRERLVDLARADHRPVRVWSAGCAAGEEAYTLAAVMHEAGLAGRYTVLGTDLSGSAVAAAREGIYGMWALRGLGERETSRFFTSEGQRFRVREHVRSGVEFLQHNVLEPLPRDAGPFDVIFCRNLLIYLTPEAVNRAACRLAAALAPRGLLVTGVGDPLLDRVEGLEAFVTDHGLAYQRTSSGPKPSVTPVSTSTKPQAPHPPRAPEPTPAPVSAAEGARLVTRAADALHKAQARTAERLARRALVAVPRSREAHRLLVLALAQGGMLTESLQAAATAVATFPADGGVRHLHAVILLESGDVAGARRAATRAVHLSPALAPAHLLLARVHDLLGHQEEARECRRHGRQLIAAEIGSG